MAITINALTTGTGGLETTADASGSFSFQSDGSTIATVTSSGFSVTGTFDAGSLQVGGSNVVVDSDIGSTVQAYDADLTTLAGLSSADGNFIVGSATGWVVESGATVRTSLGLGTAATTASTDYATAAQGSLADSALQSSDIGSTVQAYDADTAKYDDVTANFTGTLQNGGSNVVVDSDIGSTVQGYDADLSAIGGLANTDGNFIVGDGSTWVAESGATVRTSLGLGSIATQASSAVTITGGSITGITDLAVADGGTGQGSYTDGELLIGNTTGNTLTKATLTAGSGISVTNGSGAITIASTGGGGFSNMDVITSTSTWTNPGSVTKVKVTVVGGGGGGSGGYRGPTQAGGGGGGGGGAAIEVISIPTSPVPATIGGGGSAGPGNAGASGGTGGTSSFGAYCSATGGAGGKNPLGFSGGGQGGLGASAQLNIQGTGGTPASNGAANKSVGGTGGSSVFGGGSASVPDTVGTSGIMGGGGSGKPVLDSAGGGGAGGAGIIVVEY